ncbi:hypothetical protein RB614_40550 [Phytohabitans sp. ZYX-F-186]|uniref:Uncharacterized protein n=1 Tax=Phytohabitans maris TaxID=3071409 RepID=A0ABU0ZUS8_9ACTN|nr:hypothetical protein [Phytohabitans sp. ZYX-F-186]MDQ7910801.1 hypothetical protein [Phytohabitans sp. ZYX-F-186]
MAKGRQATNDDAANLSAWALLKIAGRSEAGRQAFRDLSPAHQEEIQAAAAAERERQANGPHLRF